MSTSIDELELDDQWDVSLSKINSNFISLNENKIETGTIVTEINGSGDDVTLWTTKAIVNKIWALWGWNVVNTSTPDDEDPVVFDWITGNLVKKETRGTAFNKSYWVSSTDIVEIASTLAWDSLVITDVNWKLSETSFWDNAWEVCEWNDDRLAQATTSNKWIVTRADDLDIIDWIDLGKYITPDQLNLVTLELVFFFLINNPSIQIPTALPKPIPKL